MSHPRWSPLRAELRRNKPLKRVGKKGARDRAEMALTKGVLIARSGGQCEAKGFSPHCTGVGNQAHHILRRSQGGSNDPENLLWVDNACHTAIHANPELARLSGYLKHGWEEA